MSTAHKITGRSRRYTTRKSVKILDATAKFLISLGGIATILAIIGVFVFLTSVVIPLFQKAQAEALPHLTELQAKTDTTSMMAVDEQLLSAWLGEEEGASLRVFRLDNGATLRQLEVFAGRRPQALAFSPQEGLISAAFADGAIESNQVAFRTDFLVDETHLPSQLQALQAGEVAVYEYGMVQRTPAGQLRRIRLEITPQPSLASGIENIRLLDVLLLGTGPLVATLSEDGIFRLQKAFSRRNLITGQITTTITEGSLDLSSAILDRPDPPAHLLVHGVGNSVFLVWQDGHLLRLDTRELRRPQVAEELNILPKGDASLTALSLLLGKSTLMVGDSAGRVQAWFLSRGEQALSPDSLQLNLVHDLGQGPAAVTVITPSTRSRLAGVGYADGTTRLYHVTSNQLLIEQRMGWSPVVAMAVAPRENMFSIVTAQGYGSWLLDLKHPDVNLHTIFDRVHYEGASEPDFVWQSTGATDAFEPKFSLIPLIFGTLKATFYSLLIGIPLALLAAIYTSEFLANTALRSKIKPMVEMMESVPTVILGFFAALVFATFVEGEVAGVMAAFITVPLSFVLLALLFQLQPVDLFFRFSRWHFHLILLLALPLGILMAGQVGPMLESLLFAGDLKAWLAGQVGVGTGGWFIILLPISVFMVIFSLGAWLTPFIRGKTGNYNRLESGLLEIAKFSAGALATLALAWLMASLLTALGLDPRGDFPVVGHIVGDYIQRNALIVGFAMGFSMIPAVYTIAEDALSSVPNHLRSGSLAAGATPWQTAIWVVIPIAASGLFSAVMLGMGRAVGDTMIVLMATGNTAIMDINIFNGFRTLSANIAVEMPEAAADSTHYRLLFLSALILFLMTFVINTVAEIVRQRFRKRAFEL